MKLELSIWTHHLTHLVYSFFYYCKVNKVDVNIEHNAKIKHNTALLIVNNKTALFDYSDDTKFLVSPNDYDFYFKRSLLEEDRDNNVYPLNFNVPMAYKSYLLLLKLNKHLLFHKFNRTEVIRALDVFGFFTNSAHGILDVRKYPKKIEDYGGNVLFYTRLWNPDNHLDMEEKERRLKQNEFRINACRIIKKEFTNASVGLYSDSLSNKVAPDLVLSHSKSDKKKYLKELLTYNIGVADDGLKNTPGWKIGEYLFYGKAVITTPLNICIENFEEHINFEKLSNRSSHEEIPEKIIHLLKDKKYLEMGENNFIWSNNYIHPKNYINRILNIVDVNIY